MQTFQIISKCPTGPTGPTGHGIFFTQADADYYAKRSEMGPTDLAKIPDYIFDGHLWVAAFEGSTSLGSVPFYACLMDGKVVLEQCDGAYDVFNLFYNPATDDAPEMEAFDKVNFAFAGRCAELIFEDQACPSATVSIGGRELHLICHFFE